MTPVWLQEMHTRSQRDADWTRTGRDRRELLDYIDILHEDLRLTRAERDAEKHKCLEYRKENAALRHGQGRASC